MSQNLSPAAVVIGALRVKILHDHFDRAFSRAVDYEKCPSPPPPPPPHPLFHVGMGGKGTGTHCGILEHYLLIKLSISSITQVHETKFLKFKNCF